MADLEELFLQQTQGAADAGVDIASVFSQARTTAPAVADVLAPKNAPKSSDTGIINGFPATRSGTPPSESVADANAFIRKNREGGGDKVAALFKGNALAEQAGVRAEIGPNGEISLTNVPQQPVALGGQGPGKGAIAPNTPLSVGSLFNQLKTTSDVDTARGIGASLREAGAIEAAKFETQAQTFAATKLGLPRLQAELNAAMAADQSDPKYLPGMGDSPITAKIRTNIEQITSLAGTEAARFLAGNAQYAVLKATLSNADSELARITRLGDRKAAIEDNAALRSAMKREDKEATLEDAARGLSGVQRQRLIMLNPELGSSTPDKIDADMMRTIQVRSKDKAWQQVFDAPEEAMPVLAVMGNAYAAGLIQAKEQANAGVDPAITSQRIQNVQKLMGNPTFMKQALEQQYMGQKDAKKLIADELAAFNAKGLSAEGKQQQQAQKAALALSLVKQSITAEFAGNAGSWKIADPLFQGAVQQARQVTNGTKMMDVYAAYTKDVTGPALVQKTQAFADLMTQEALKNSKSIFGAPNYLALRSQLARQTATSYMQLLGNAGKAVFGVSYDKPEDSEWKDPMTQQDFTTQATGRMPGQS